MQRVATSRLVSRVEAGLLAALSIQLILAPGLMAAPQDDGILRLKTETRLIEVVVSVRDRRGSPVTDLKASDFVITDNGKPRSFTIFNLNEIKSAAPDSVGGQSETPRTLPSLPPNMFTNTRISAPPTSGHSTIILLDGVSGWFDSFVLGSKGVQALMNRVPADEKIALYVISKGQGLGIIQDYTTDRQLLTHAMATFIPRSTSPAPAGTGPGGDGDGMKERASPMGGVITRGRPRYPTGDSVRDLELQMATESVRLSMQALAERLRSLPGRKSVFWVTEGFPPQQLRGMNSSAWDKTFAALNDANLEINTVDTDGLGGPARMWGPGGILTMQQIAEKTGGEAFFHRNDLDAAMATGIAHTRSSYTLGFYVTEADGKYHELKVRADRPNLQLNYRQGYWARSEGAAEVEARKSDLDSVLLNPIDSTGLGIVARLDVTAGKPHSSLNVHLLLDPQALSIAKSAAGWTGKIEELFVELNGAGRQVGRIAGKTQFEVPIARKAKYDVQGMAFSQTMRLAEGATKLLIVVRDTASGRTGSLTASLGDIVPREANGIAGK